MAAKIIVPSEGSDVCLISECCVNVGDTVHTGDLICSVETDKAVIDVVAPCDGVVLALLHEVGDEVPAFETLAIVGQQGEDIGALTKSEEVSAAQQKPEALPEPDTLPAVQTQTSVSDARSLVSPRAKRYAHTHGVPLEGITGTGMLGSVTECDVIAAMTQTVEQAMQNPTEEYTVKTLTKMQKASAKHMLESLQQSAQLTLCQRVCVDKLLQLRSRMKQDGEALGMHMVTVNDLYCFAVTRTLPDFPELNAIWSGDELHIYRSVHLGVAVDTENGLVVPVIRNAQTLSLSELSDQSHILAQRCRTHMQSVQDLTGGTFSVSNLGSFGIEMFTPILNTPQVAILGVGAPVERLTMDGGVVRSTKEAMLSLTVDHRAVDGAPAARFLAALRRNIENIDILLGK